VSALVASSASSLDLPSFNARMRRARRFRVLLTRSAGSRSQMPSSPSEAGGEPWADSSGVFILDMRADVVHVRAQGYLRAAVAAEALRPPTPEIRLTPFRAKALYLSVYGIGDRTLRAAALNLLATTETNALVIDLKGDRGIIPIPAKSFRRRIGAQRVITIPDLSALVGDLQRRGIYTIARIVVFKDNLLALGRQTLAVRRQDGSIYRDREGLAWTNPYSRDVWRYSIDVAVEAASAGFDEIQFDYLRLPDTTGLVYDMPWTEQNRVAAIQGFLTEARRKLTPSMYSLRPTSSAMSAGIATIRRSVSGSSNCRKS
jgi:hypothetical protein